MRSREPAIVAIEGIHLSTAIWVSIFGFFKIVANNSNIEALERSDWFLEAPGELAIVAIEGIYQHMAI